MFTTSSSSALLTEPPAATGGAVAYVGCSGWHYKHWRGRVYDESLPTSAWLRAYAERFPTVEINNSFYRLPSEQTFASWREQAPRGFLFALKASRFLTHIKRLREPDEPLERFFAHARPLGPTLGPVLYQLPPRWFPDEERLRQFLAALPPRLAPGSRHRLVHVLEFRDPRGYEPWVIALLREYGVALCVHDMPGSASPMVVTGPIVYLRLHGYGRKYGGSYPDQVLSEWAEWIARVTSSGREAFVYFNNDMNGYAVHDATRLTAIVEALTARHSGSGRAVATARPRRSHS
jgi:uncharacterized protein YecE (DUF72 family)